MDVRLTDREIEILQSLLDFEGNINAVADKLCISRATVRNHLHTNIYKKLMVNSLLGAVKVALTLNLLHIDKSS